MAEQHTIQVDIVSAEGEIFSGPAIMVFAPGSQGDLGIAPRHAPLLTLLKPGACPQPRWLHAAMAAFASDDEVAIGLERIRDGFGKAAG